jgi:hypothetical protein
MNRRNQILAGVLVLQLIVLAVVFWPRGGAANAGQALFPGVQSDQIAKLKVTGSDGKTVQLVKDGETWVLAETDGFPVLGDKASTVLTDVVELKASRPVATTASSQKRLKVASDDYERLVEFELSDGSQHRLYLGTSPSYGATHVRADDQQEVYLASLQAQDFGTDASSWIDRTYLTAPQDQVTGLKLQNAQGTVDLQKSGSTWIMTGLAAGETLDDTKVQSLLTRISPLTMLRPLGKTEQPEYGLAQPSALLEVKTADKTFLLRVGSLDPADTSFVVSSSESPYIVRVGQYYVSDLVDKGRDWFLIQPTPVPTPAPTAAP